MDPRVGIFFWLRKWSSLWECVFDLVFCVRESEKGFCFGLDRRVFQVRFRSVKIGRGGKPGMGVGLCKNGRENGGNGRGLVERNRGVFVGF